MVGKRAGGTNALHAVAMVVIVAAAAFVVGYVVFDLEVGVLPDDTQPDASFEFSYDADVDRLVVTHRGGDSLNASRVVVLDQGYQEVGTWSASDAVTAGDSATVTDVTRRDTVYVAWVTGDGTFVVLATWNPNPEADRSTTTATARTATFLPRME